MKAIKSFFAAAAMFIMASVNVNAQMINRVNLEKCATSQYGENWKRAAELAMNQQQVDQQGNMVSNKTINCAGMTKEDLYVEMVNWFICNYEEAIEYADKEQGVIIARPYVENIACSKGGFNAYNISINPTVRVKVTDGKVEVSYTQNCYNVVTDEAGGIGGKALRIGVATAAVTAAVASEAHDAHSSRSHRTEVVSHYSSFGRGHSVTTYTVREYRPRHHFDNAVLASCIAGAALAAHDTSAEKWAINYSYPFATKDSHKKASSKAFVMSSMYSQVVMDNIEAALSQCKEAYNLVAQNN